MPALPPSTDFTGSAVTEGGFKTAISNQRAFLAGLLGTTGGIDVALATLGALGGQSVAKVAAYTVLAADRGKVFECSGTFTLTLTAAATLRAGFSFIVVNTGSGTITIDPNSTELINGASTVTIEAGAWAVISCNGTAFRSMKAGTVPSGTLIGYTIFTATGSYTKATKNPSFVVVELVGGGAGGVTGYNGSAGGYASKKILASALAASETVTVGAGGATANSGGTSSFGALVSATGGNYTTGNGGVGSGGDINITGGGCSNGTGIGFAGAASFFGGGKWTNAGGTGAPGSGGAAGAFAGTAGIVIVWEYA